jgi:hypothetical protein
MLSGIIYEVKGTIRSKETKKGADSRVTETKFFKRKVE